MKTLYFLDPGRAEPPPPVHAPKTKLTHKEVRLRKTVKLYKQFKQRQDQ